LLLYDRLILIENHSPSGKNYLCGYLCGAAPKNLLEGRNRHPGGLFFNDVRHIETPLQNYGSAAHGGTTPVRVLAPTWKQTGYPWISHRRIHPSRFAG
jgi:hypothetical protein